MKKPFFIVNPKSYLYGDKLYSLAKKADELSKNYDVKILFTAPFIELKTINEITKNIVLTAQHMDEIEIGRGMGRISGDMLKYVGVKAVVLNHAEHKLSREKLEKILIKAKNLGLETIVCASDYEEVKYISKLFPTTILCEPTNLIGTGVTSSDEYIRDTTKIIREINPKINVMQAAGVSNPEDVYRIIYEGADSTGCTSGIVLANNPEEMLENMIISLLKAYKEREN